MLDAQGEHGDVLCGALSLVMMRTPEVLSSLDLERMQEPDESVENEDGEDGVMGEDGVVGEDGMVGEDGYTQGGEGGGSWRKEVGGEGEAAVLSKVLLLVMALAQLSEEGRAWVCARMVDPLVQVVLLICC